MNNALRYKGYLAVVEFDAADESLSGHVLGLGDEIYFEGDSATGIVASFHAAVDEYLAACEELGRPPEKPKSGKLHLRLPPELHRKAEALAKAEGASLNQWLTRRIRSGVESAEHRAGDDGGTDARPTRKRQLAAG